MPQTVTAINITSFGAGSGFDLPAGTSGSPNDAAVTGGNLVLTTAANSQAGIAVYQTPFSAYGSVSFDFTYNSSGGTGADGLSFFLLNGDALTGGANSVTPGGYGGGLGYSDDGRAGITDGWLGLGFDTFGNYSDSDGGQTPATPANQASPNTIGVRGAGSGSSGYAYLDGARFSPGIDGTREVDVTLNDGTGANGTPQETLTVRVSTDGGSTWTTPISNYAINQPVPGSLYFGFAASTGGSTDLHEIKAVKDSQLTFGAVTIMDTTTGATNPATLSAGDNFSYTTSLFNNNTSAITTTLNDAAPPNATNLAWTITDGNSGQVFTGTGPLTAAAVTLAMSSGDTETVTVTGKVAQNASSGNLNHTLTAISAASGANPSQTVSVAIDAGGTTPAITTIDADQATATSDQSTAHPFSGATIYDGDTAGTVTATVTLADPSLGMLSSTGASYDVSTGVLTIVGTPAQAQTALQGVTFTPNADTQEIGTTATSGLSVTVADSNGESSTDSRGSIQVTYADTGATISGLGQSAAAGQSVDPLANTTVTDSNLSAMTVSVTVAGDASGSKGTFSNAGSWTVSTQGSDLVYSRSFAAQTNIGAAVSSAIQGLAFSTPTSNPPGAATVDFTVGTVDDAAMTASAVVPLTVNTPHVGPTGTAGAAQQTTDEQSATPFSTTALSDPDNLGLTLSVTIPGGASGTVGDFTNASAWTRAVSGSDVTYTLHLSAQPNVGAAAQAALQALTFQPAAHVADPGTTTSDLFSVSLQDSMGGTVVVPQALTVVAAADQPSIAVAAPLSTTDAQAAAPFSGTVVSDPDHTAFTLSATIIGGASGSVGDFTNTSGWTRAISGSDVTYTRAFADQPSSGSAATAALQALAFQPTAHVNAAGSTTQADFTVGFTDTVTNESATAPVALNVTAVEDGPTIQVGAVQTATDVAGGAPFTTTTVLDPDVAGMTLSVSFDAAQGDFTNATGWTRAQSGATVTYTKTLAQAADIGGAATAALQALAFQPPAHAALQGTTSDDSFTLTATDSLAATASSPVALQVSNTVDPVIATAGPTQSISDEQAAQPFSAMTVAQPDNTPMTLTVTIPNGASGTVGDFTNASAWTRTVSGSDITYTLQLPPRTNAGAAAQAALQALTFAPAAHVAQPGTVTSDSFGVTLEDASGNVQSLSQPLTVTAAEDQPAIAAVPTSGNDSSPISPFAGTVVSDPDLTSSVLTVTIPGGASGNVGTFTQASSAGWTRTVSGSDLTYTLPLAAPGSGAAATSALQALVFQPADHANLPGSVATVDFGVSFSDAQANTALAQVPLAVTAQETAPAISSLTSVQTSDEQAASPFSATTVTDPDNTGLALSVSFDGRAGDFTNMTGWTRQVSGNTVTYSTALAQAPDAGAAATAALNTLMFRPTAHDATPGTVSSDPFSVSVTDTSGAQAVATIPLSVTSASDALSATAGPAQSTSDEQAAQPFVGMTVAQPDDTPLTLSVTIPGGASGSVGDFTNASAWTRTVSGSDITYTLRLSAQTDAGAAGQMALQSLTFQPAAHVAQPGTVTSDSFGVTVEDGSGNVQSLSQPLAVTSSETAPVLSVARAPNGSDDQTASSPLSGVSVSDPDLTGMTVAVTIPNGASGSVGDFTNASAWTRTVSGGDVTYTLHLPIQANVGAAAQAAFQALTFQPAPFAAAPGTVTNDRFLVSTTDTSGATSTATATLPVTAAYVPPTITAASPAQITDEQAAQPFSKTVVSEPDDIGGTLSVTIPGGASGTVGDFTNASAWTRTVSGSDVTYTLHLSAQPNVGAAAQAALQALTFQPTTHRNVPGTLTKDIFAVRFADNSGGTTTAQTSLSVLAAQDPVIVSSGAGNTSSGNSGGTVSGNATYDVETTTPFPGFTVTDPDNQSVIATVVVAGDASATKGDFTDASAWTRTASGSDLIYTQSFAARPNIGSVVQAALQALTFAPARLDPGATQSVAFSASITPAGGATTQVASTSLAVTGALRPYLDLSVADKNPNDTVTVAATLPSAAVGNYAGLGIGAASGNTYDITGTPDQVTADLHALAFIPSASNGTLPGDYAAVVVSSGSGAALVDAGPGTDTLVASAPGVAAFGGAGNDMLIGSAKGSSLVGGGGDNIFVAIGADTISAGTGSSTVYTGAGNTTVFAKGQTTVVGAGGAMNVYGAADSTTTVFGGQSGLTFIGEGTATVIGAAGANTVFGGAGKLAAFGSSNSSGTFWGGAAGGNVLVAGGEASTLVGVANNDLLVAQNAAQDVLVAGAGSETVQTSGSMGNNTYFAGSGNDTMVLGRGNETVVGGSGNATIFGGAGNMTLFAGTGSTLVNGSASGGDTFIASSGNTTIWGGLGAANTYDVVAGHAGGTLTIDDFRVGKDKLSINGYSAADLASAQSGAVSTASGTVLTLSDGTGITLLGLDHAQTTLAHLFDPGR